VVHVQVRADHHVDRVGGKARRPQVLQKRRAHHVERLAPSAVLVVADAGVDQRGETRRLEDEAVNGLQEAALLIEEVGRQPVAVALDGLGHRLRQEPGLPRGARPLDDGGDAEPTNGQRVHTAR
jgi:hypothetical protein